MSAKTRRVTKRGTLSDTPQGCSKETLQHLPAIVRGLYETFGGHFVCKILGGEERHPNLLQKFWQMFHAVVYMTLHPRHGCLKHLKQKQFEETGEQQISGYQVQKVLYKPCSTVWQIAQTNLNNILLCRLIGVTFLSKQK